MDDIEQQLMFLETNTHKFPAVMRIPTFRSPLIQATREIGLYGVIKCIYLQIQNLVPFCILLLSYSVSMAQPVNDNPCGATTLTVGTTCNLVTYSTAGASNTGGLGAIDCTPVNKDVWFKITVPASGMFTIETAAGTITDAIVATYTGDCTDLVYAYCDDDSGPGTMPLLEQNGFIPGSTAYIRFSKKAGGTGTFSICVWDDNPALAPNNDCITAQRLCTEQSFTANTTGNGDIDDLTATNKGCLNPNEHQTTWYYVTFDLPGELNFTITPLDPDDNYNFAVWGPDPSCPLTVPPIRCSASNEDGATGINTGSTDLTETAGGDGWVKHITVNSGETYLIMIDNYSETGIGFTFEFGGPPTISCDPYVLPVVLTQFVGYSLGADNVLNWTTSTEINNALFSIERSDNGHEFYKIGEVAGSGTTTETHTYNFTDRNPFYGISYYRLVQTDFNGNDENSEIINITNLTENGFNIYPNPSTGIMYVTHSENAGSTYTISIFSSTGSKVFSTNGIATDGSQTDKLSILQKGIYWVVLTNGDQSFAEKMVIH